MRKILVLLLVVGILAGTYAIIENVCERNLLGEQADFAGEELQDGPWDPAPCGGGEGSGSGGVPG